MNTTTDTISPIDIQFARMMQRLAGEKSQLLDLAARLVSSQTRTGHICLDLADLADREFLNEKLNEELANKIPTQTTGDLRSGLQGSSVVGKPGDFQPLILDDNDLLYLNRYWRYQETLAQFVLARSKEPEQTIEPGKAGTLLNKYFKDSSDIWQKVAAAVSLYKSFCVITGGPGSGKTFTVAKIIALLLEQFPEFKIALAAPTGKAANRLQQSIKAAKADLPCPDELKARIPDEASTLHRLLGAIRYSPHFRRNAANPLEFDVVIVDEASMVAIGMMAKLVTALPAGTKLILLGDHNQLASVEAGAALADICGNGPLNIYSNDFRTILEEVTGASLPTGQSSLPGIQDCIVQLRHNYRFNEKSGIMALSEAVNCGDADLALEILRDEKYDDVQWKPSGANVLSTILPSLKLQSDSASPAEIFANLSRLRVLCAVREGPQGIHAINPKIEQFVRRTQAVNFDERWYHGQPILISENDYGLNLFNGDVGVILRDADGSLVTFFQEEGAFRRISPFRLPAHELAYAMTVHKSQGSEFDRVLLILPDQDSPVLTRELLYTGITRATAKVEIQGSEESLRAAVARKTRRTSGLRPALWNEKG